MKEIIAAEVDIGFGKSISSYKEFEQLQGQIVRQTIDLREKNKELRKELKRINNDQSKDLETRKKLRSQLTEQIAGNNRQIKSLAQETRRLNGSFDAIDESNGAFKRLTARVRELKNEVKDFRAEGKVVPQSTLDELDELQTKFEDISTSVGDFQFNVGNYGSAFSSLGDTIKSRLSDVLDGSSGGVQASIKGLGDDFGKFAAGGGLIAGAVAGVGIIASSVVDATVKFQGLRNTVATTTNAIGDDIDVLVIGAEALDATFDDTFENISKSANALAANELTSGFADSIDLLRKAGLAAGPAFNEINSQITEYSARAKEAGISGNELAEISIRSIRDGLFSDKGVDTIVEGAQRIREQTDATVKAVSDRFGAEFSNDLFAGIRDGSVSSVQALKKIGTQLKSTDVDIKETQTLVADLFGGPGEEISLEFIESLESIEGNIDSLIPATDSLTQRNLRLFEANEKLATAQNEISKVFSDSSVSIQVLSAELKANLFEALSIVLDALDTLGDLFGDLFGSFGEGASLADILTSSIKNTALGFRFVVEIGTSVISFFADLIGSISEFVSVGREGANTGGFFATAFDKIREALSNIPAFLDGVSAGIGQLLSNLANFEFEVSPFDAFNAAFDENIAKAEEAKTAVEKTTNTFNGMGDAIERIAKGSLEDLSGQISKLNEQIEKTPDLELQVKLSAEIEQLEAQAELIRNRIQRRLDEDNGVTRTVETIDSGADLSTEDTIATLITSLGLEKDAKVASEMEEAEALGAIKDLARKDNIDRFKGEFDEKLAIETEYIEASRSINNDAVKATASLLGTALAGGIESFRDFQKEIILIALDALEKTILLKIVESTAALIAKHGLILGSILSISATALIKGAFSEVKAKVTKFEEGGILKGPSHAQGGIQMHNRRTGAYYGEAQGGEPILKKEVSQNSNALGLASYVNQKFKGKNIGGSILPPDLQTSIDKYIAGGRSVFSPPPSRIMVDGGVLTSQGSVVVVDIDYERLGKEFSKAAKEIPPNVVGLVELSEGLDNLANIQENSTI